MSSIQSETRTETMSLSDGERRTVTVLFSDMKGFTSLSEHTDPEVMDTLMTKIFGRFEEIIRRRGGYVEKYIGDALVAVFGAQEIHEDDPVRAIDAALDFIEEIRRNGAGYPPQLAFRTGIHTGLVTTGKRGVFEVVTGHTLAVASRLQEASAANGVLVSADTKALCLRRFDFAGVQDLIVKGKDEKLVAFAVLGRKREVFEYDTPFIGRVPELERLVGEYVRHMRDAANGQPRGAYVTGDGGIGKTRLCAQLWARFKLFPAFSATLLIMNPIREGRSDFASLRSAMLDFFEDSGIGANIDPQELSRAAQEHLALGERATRTVALLANRGDRGYGEDFIDGLCELFSGILSHDGDVYPDVIVIDNASALDEQSMAFFRRFLSSGKNMPFVILCDQRLNADVSAIFGSQAVEELKPLSDDEGSSLARAIAPGIDESGIALIVERSQGYPLFIEEYAKLALCGCDTGDIPDTIQTTILASIDRLDPESKALLQKLSVFRNSFRADFARAVEERTDGDPETVDERLALLVGERALSRGKDGLFDFKHRIIREAVASSVLHRNRRLLHAILAERIRQDEAEPSAEEFYHLVNAEDWDGARTLLISHRPSLTLDYVVLVETVIDHSRDCPPATFVELLFVNYAVRFNNHDFGNLDAIVKRMYVIALRERDRFILARTYHLLMTSAFMKLDYDSAALYGRKAIDAYEGAGNERGAVNARIFLVQCYVARGLFDRAIETVEGIKRVDLSSESNYAMARAIIHFRRGEHKAVKYWNEEAARLDTEDGRSDEADKLHLLCAVNALQNFEYEDAASDDASVYCTGCVEPEELLPYYCAVAVAQTGFGHKESGRDAFVKAEYYYKQLSSDGARVDNGLCLVNARLFSGEHDAARKLAEELLGRASAINHFVGAFELEILLAEIALIEGNMRDFSFFVRDASILADEPLCRERKVEARYRYFAWLLLESSGEGGDFGERLSYDDRDELLADAKRLVEAEMEALLSDAARERMLGASVYRRILEA